MSSRRGPYRIEWAWPARRALERLPERVGVAAVEFTYGPPANNPQRVGRELRFELEGHHAAHRGDYRIVYRIDVKQRVVFILTIDHRADVYCRR